MHVNQTDRYFKYKSLPLFIFNKCCLIKAQHALKNKINKYLEIDSKLTPTKYLYM